ncbi:methyltransferase domain-containing protein [Candidatus Parcubacteria bacterium]|nr:MAG: methyltransferase domain-containing protein [Candidatus Parcubacteria bacterium]
MHELPILPRTFSSHTVTQHYASVAWFYDLWARLTEDKAVKRVFHLADIRDGMDILEVAVGTGRLFRKIVEKNPHGRNEGVDLSANMLAHARRRLAQTRSSSWNLQTGSAFSLPFPGDSFDLVFNTYMLDLLPETDFPKALGEFHRVLRPGGRLALVTFGFGEFWFNRFWFWLAKTFPSLLTNCRPVRVGALLEQIGLRVIHSETVSQNTFPSDVIIAIKGETR